MTEGDIKVVVTEKITKVVGAPEEQPGTKVHGEVEKGVTILSKDSKIEPTPVEITKGEGDRDE